MKHTYELTVYQRTYSERYWRGEAPHGTIQICKNFLDEWVIIPEGLERIWLVISDEEVEGATVVRRRFDTWVSSIPRGVDFITDMEIGENREEVPAWTSFAKLFPVGEDRWAWVEYDA